MSLSSLIDNGVGGAEGQGRDKCAKGSQMGLGELTMRLESPVSP